MTLILRLRPPADSDSDRACRFRPGGSGWVGPDPGPGLGYNALYYDAVRYAWPGRRLRASGFVVLVLVRRQNIKDFKLDADSDIDPDEMMTRILGRACGLRAWPSEASRRGCSESESRSRTRSSRRRAPCAVPVLFKFACAHCGRPPFGGSRRLSGPRAYHET